jgi:Type IV secretion system pilin
MKIKIKLTFVGLLALLTIVTSGIAAPVSVFAAGNCPSGPCCGGKAFHQVQTSIAIGCKGVGNPITDMLFAILRFLTAGVGIVIVGSLIWAGIQYIFSQDDPSAVSAAKNRILHSVIALLMFIFAFAILDFIIPQGIFL